MMSEKKLTGEEQEKLLRVVFNVDGALDKLIETAAERCTKIAKEQESLPIREDGDSE